MLIVRDVRLNHGLFLMLPHERKILQPFDARESISTDAARKIAGDVTTETIRLWSAVHGIGCKIGGRWYVSRPALYMWLDRDRAALAAYHRGDRSGPLVAPYFERAGLRNRAA